MDLEIGHLERCMQAVLGTTGVLLEWQSATSCHALAHL